MKSTFKKVKEHGYRIIIDGHDTFAEDVVRKLERLDYLEKERLKRSDNSGDVVPPKCSHDPKFIIIVGAKGNPKEYCLGCCELV